MNRKRWMILAVCMLVLLSLAACGKADGGDDSGAAALESVLRQVRDKLDEAKHDEAESGSTADDSEPEPEKTPEPTPEPSAATLSVSGATILSLYISQPDGMICVSARLV